jgi:hypothetical protein
LIVVQVLVPAEVAVAETTQERRLVTHFEDLLDVFEVESGPPNVVLRVQRVVNTWNFSR